MNDPIANKDWLGHIVELTVQRFGPPGAFLSDGTSDSNGENPTVLLPRGEVPNGTKPGDSLSVFVYLDTEDRPIATLTPPKLELGEVAFLDVTDTAPFGAFVDWGPLKELLVPLAEQTTPLSVGDRHPIGLYLDDSRRLAGSMRVTEMLKSTAEFTPDEWVSGEAWRNDPRIGLFVILERRFVGLVPAQEPHTLERGEAASFRVATVLEDGKITLSLRGHALDERENDAARILGILKNRKVRVGDHTSPDQVRALFGLSKKAFKRALGLLLKEKKIQFDREGNVVVPSRRRIVG